MCCTVSQFYSFSPSPAVRFLTPWFSSGCTASHHAAIVCTASLRLKFLDVMRTIIRFSFSPGNHEGHLERFGVEGPPPVCTARAKFSTDIEPRLVSDTEPRLGSDTEARPSLSTT